MSDIIHDLGIPHPVTPYPKLIINAAITGMVPQKADTPHVPITVEEIIEDTIRCWRAGASIVHLHGREESGEPAYQKEIYAQMIPAIRKACPDLIVCATTSGRRHSVFEQRSDVLDLAGDARPDMASLTMGSLNFPKQASVNAPEMIQRLALKMKERGIIPEIEVFEPGMISAAKILINRGILAPPFYFNLLLGSMFSIPATLFDLTYMVQSLPPHVTWAAAGIGRFQLKMNTAAILMGGHVRVGLEDNIFFDQDRKELATNERLLQRIVRLARELQREVASPKEARAMIGLDRPPV